MSADTAKAHKLQCSYTGGVGRQVTCIVLMGVWMTGPLPDSMSKGMPMPVSGVRISENRMTPSGLKARQGCSEISTCTTTSVNQIQGVVVVVVICLLWPVLMNNWLANRPPRVGTRGKVERKHRVMGAPCAIQHAGPVWLSVVKP